MEGWQARAGTSGAETSTLLGRVCQSRSAAKRRHNIELTFADHSAAGMATTAVAKLIHGQGSGIWLPGVPVGVATGKSTEFCKFRHKKEQK